MKCCTVYHDRLCRTIDPRYSIFFWNLYLFMLKWNGGSRAVQKEQQTKMRRKTFSPMDKSYRKEALCYSRYSAKDTSSNGELDVENHSGKSQSSNESGKSLDIERLTMNRQYPVIVHETNEFEKLHGSFNKHSFSSNQESLHEAPALPFERQPPVHIPQYADSTKKDTYLQTSKIIYSNLSLLESMKYNNDKS